MKVNPDLEEYPRGEFAKPLEVVVLNRLYKKTCFYCIIWVNRTFHENGKVKNEYFWINTDKALFKVIVHDENGNAVKECYQSNLFEIIESNCQDI